MVVSSRQVSPGSTWQSRRSSCAATSEYACHVMHAARSDPSSSCALRAFFVDVLSSFLTSTKFTRYELQEWVAPVCEAESTAAFSDPATRALELAHALAFRAGLGNSIFAAPGHPAAGTAPHPNFSVQLASPQRLLGVHGILAAERADMMDRERRLMGSSTRFHARNPTPGSDTHCACELEHAMA